MTRATEPGPDRRTFQQFDVTYLNKKTVGKVPAAKENGRHTHSGTTPNAKNAKYRFSFTAVLESRFADPASVLANTYL